MKLTSLAAMTMAATLLVSSSVVAEPQAPASPAKPAKYLKRSNPGPIQFVDTPPSAFAPGDVSNVIFLNRCNDPESPCLVRASSRNDSTTDESTIPSQNTTLSAFDADDDNAVTPNSAENDMLWDAYASCVEDVFAPYNVVVTQTDPGSTPHTEIKTGGYATEIGYEPGSGVLGVAPGTSSCSPFRNAIVFVFANAHPNAYPNQTRMIEEMCAAAAQEAAHAFTLDHVGSCTDPMTYENNCGVRKYFRNLEIRCGAFENNIPGFPEESPRDCKCGAPQQNAHKSLLGFFGAGVEPEPPTLAITSPSNNGTISASADVAVSVTSLHPRGLNRIDIFLNGWLWGTVEGKSPEAQGAGNYNSILLPKNVVGMPETVPNGVIDIEVRSYHDLEGTPAVENITVTKGAPCSDATECAVGQQCDAGKCFWTEPVLELGETCEYNQACVSESCLTADGESRCSKACNTFSADSCPSGFTCLDTGGSAGVCWPAAKKGCGCAATNATAGEAALQLLVAASLGLWLFRRRRNG